MEGKRICLFRPLFPNLRICVIFGPEALEELPQVVLPQLGLGTHFGAAAHCLDNVDNGTVVLLAVDGGDDVLLSQLHGV